ncbi:cytochrome o ubiquinol oxidase subunit IV [Salinisphaera sp. RV14]|uniref:cytochrome o ubiquinol oxidase subunit IV n=1 Tax=unclassified Salinisphaera TaxID=2649847 RepID=UPI003F8617E8
MSRSNETLEHPEVQLGGIVSYTVGYGLSIMLSGLAFGLVHTRALPRPVMFGALCGIAFALVLVQMFLFLGLNLNPGHRWKTAATLFTLPILILMIVLTIWVFYTLQLRVMPH